MRSTAINTSYHLLLIVRRLIMTVSLLYPIERKQKISRFLVMSFGVGEAYYKLEDCGIVNGNKMSVSHYAFGIPRLQYRAFCRTHPQFPWKNDVTQRIHYSGSNVKLCEQTFSNENMINKFNLFFGCYRRSSVPTAFQNLLKMRNKRSKNKIMEKWQELVRVRNDQLTVT